MKKIILTAVFACGIVCMVPAIAQTRQSADPKEISARMAEKLQFTDAQMAQLDALNKKYPGTDYDKQKYREEFRSIMTPEQKRLVDDKKQQMKERHGGGKGY